MSDIVPPKFKLTSPYTSRERILLAGPAKVGKSNAVLSIARYCPDVAIHVVDNDNAYQAAIERSGYVLKNVVVHDVEDYDETVTAIREIRDYIKEDEEQRRNDWMVVDLFSATWDAVQSSFVEDIFDTTMDSYAMAKRKALQGRREADSKTSGGALGMFEQDTDWTTINHVYRQLQATLRRFPCHLIACTEVDEIDTKRKNDKEVMRLFGSYGVKPRGQKRSPHLFHTLLLMSKMGGQYVISTIGDRERTSLDEDEVTEFATDYLQKVAKWKIQIVRKAKEEVEVGDG